METSNAKTSSAPTRLLIVRAWAVHLYTALGLVLGLLAIQAVFANDAGRVIGLLGLALFIDATDGLLARVFHVKRWTPTFDGRKLDDITDYINYTLIPVLFAYRFGIVGDNGLVVLGIVLILSAYGFCNEAAKTADGYFTGFPNFWNVAIFYLYLFRLPPLANAAILMILAALVLAPIKCVSSSTRPFRRLTLTVLGLFWVALIGMGATAERVDMRLVGLSLLGPVYYIGISLYLTWVTRPRPASQP